ncbi:ATP-binding protein [candidate division CSSED10-310 bacterium]|uniref:histidine kinase n=1 Tax=candidate division CSSED10-310 bacterium TaxID=2855610 RepID=A0ABV6YZZ6_UNCC1
MTTDIAACHHRLKVEMMKKKSLFFRIFLIFTGILILTLILVRHSYRVTIRPAIQNIFLEIGLQQTHAIANDLKRFLQEPIVEVHELKKFLQNAQTRYHAHLNLYRPDGTLQATSQDDESMVETLSLTELKEKIDTPLKLSIPGVVVSLLVDNQHLGFVHYRPIVHFERKVANRFFLFLVLVGSFIIFLIYLVSKSITRPVLSLTRAAHQIGQGDLQHYAPETGPTEFAELAKQFNRMTRRVMNLISSQRDLLAGISHELRSPLTRIRVAVQIMLEKEENEATLAMLNNIATEIENVDHLIGELVTISRLELGQEPISPHKIEPGIFLTQCLDEFNEKLTALPTAGSGVHIEVNCSQDLPSIMVDEIRMKRVLHNLLENAVRYSPHKIIVSLQFQNSTLLIVVRDFGPGLSPPEMENIFRPFYRSQDLNNSRPGLLSGIGLGLYISRQIVLSHGGTLEAQTPDHSSGTEMIIRLPL